MMKQFLTILSAVLLLWSCNNPVESESSKVAYSMSKSPKRGVAFNFSNSEDLPLLTPYISWDYNWGPDQTDISAQWMDGENVDFCPMAWGRNFNADRIRNYVKVHPKCRYLLAFNEPNLNDQARMTPQQAAELWQPVVDLARELKLKLVSPAMNYGTLSGYHDPVKWLDEFFTLVDSNDIYAISVHCYMASPQALKNYVSLFEKYGKPIWLTEFCAWEDYAVHSVEDQMSYMSEALNFLEQSASVERYAWFIPRAKAGYPYMQLLTSAQPYELTPLGQMYCGFSSFDKTTWLTSQNVVRATDYIALSDDDIQVRPSTCDSGLMLSTFMSGQFADYQVYVETDAEMLILRYAALAVAEIYFYVDGFPLEIVTLPATGSMSEWASLPFITSVPHGKHTFRIEVSKGVINLSWFKL